MALQRKTKKLTYTSYEANSFKVTFEQSGATGSAVHLQIPPCV